MEMDIPRISIVIRSYNEAEHIGKLLYGIARQSISPAEVILVDSGSTDETVAVAKSLGAIVVNIEKDFFTFGRSLNQGIEVATGDIIVIVSAHVYPVSEDWLINLCQPLGRNGVVLSYGKQRGAPTTKFSEHRVFEQWFPNKSSSLEEGYFCNNANCAIQKAEWFKEKYDEDLTGLEDLAWAKAAKVRGGRIAYRADACIIHVHNETWTQVRNRYRREAMAMKRINGGHFNFFDFSHYFLRNAFSDCQAAYRKRKFRGFFQSIFLFRFNQFFGAYLGFNRDVEINSLRKRFYFAKNSSGEDSLNATEANLIDYGKFEK